MSIKLTTAYHKINALNKRTRIVQGGMGSSKTFSILILILKKALEKHIKATIVTQTYPQLKDGPISDMKTIVTMAGLDWNAMYNITDKNLSIFGSEVQFRNLDSKDFNKMKGVRRDILYVNEANRVGWKSVDQMFTRSKVSFFDFNPDQEFWAHTELMNREDTDFIILTYSDNEMLSKEERGEIERRVELSKLPDASDSLKEWVKVYAYGETGTYSERRIYDYKFCDEIPATARRIPSGLDFGRSPDKTALIDLYLDGINLYADERFCLNNLREEKIQGDNRLSIVDQMELIDFQKSHPIVADSAGRISIQDMRKHGYNVIGVKKPPGGQRDGIIKVRGYNLFITKRSINLKKDIETFSWKQDLNGKIIPEPDGHEPDTLVPIRYSLMMSV